MSEQNGPFVLSDDEVAEIEGEEWVNDSTIRDLIATVRDRDRQLEKARAAAVTELFAVHTGGTDGLYLFVSEDDADEFAKAVGDEARQFSEPVFDRPEARMLIDDRNEDNEDALSPTSNTETEEKK